MKIMTFKIITKNLEFHIEQLIIDPYYVIGES
jgi:hypothetical protein